MRTLLEEVKPYPSSSFKCVLALSEVPVEVIHGCGESNKQDFDTSADDGIGLDP